MADDPQMDQMLRAALRRRPGAAEADAAGGVCLDAESFAAWSSGALSETEGAAIERHLSTCARCQEMAAIFVQSEPPVSTTTLVAFKPRWSFRWIGPIAAAAAAGVTWLVWPVRPQTTPPKAETAVARADPDAKPADAPLSAPPARVGLPPASTPSAPVPNPERVIPTEEATRMAQTRETAAGAQPKTQGKDARDRRLDSRGATLADTQAASNARPVPPETRADPKLTAAPIQPPTVAAKPTPPPPPPPDPLLPPPPPPSAAAVPPAAAPPAGAVGGVVGGVPTRADEVRPQPTFRATMDATTVVAEFSSGSGAGVAGGGGAGRGGGGRGGGGGAATAPTANVLSTLTTPRWRILSSGGVERSADRGTSWQPLAIDPPVHVIAGTSPSPATCWLIGRGGVVLLSTDGVRFARVPFQSASELTSIRATSARDATVATPDGREFVTNDGGTTWRGRE